jgi:dTDP-4-dehydrorhamnose 3,5-epimerase
MHIDPTPIAGVFTVSADAHEDARGSFRRLWCRESFSHAGLDFLPVQSSLSVNKCRHTLRGLHWQASHHSEQKLVRCVRGKIWDVAVDMRADQPTYLCSHAVQLDAELSRSLFLPRGVAHGFLTLSDWSEVEYLVDTIHMPGSARGARWNDPSLAIAWPNEPAVISDRDRSWPDVPKFNS